MEPRIQYAKTSDGVSIAYFTLGRGTPFVQMPAIPFSHIQREWEGHVQRPFFEWIAQRHMLVRYDARGAGLSDRGFETQSIDGYLADLNAVLERAVDGKFVLMGAVNSGPVAIAYAAAHPERVSHLVLLFTFARGSDLYELPALQSFKALRDQDWEIYTNTVAHTSVGWASADQAAAWAEVLRDSVTREDAQAAFTAIETFDVSDQLAAVRVPTLVLHRRDSPFPSIENSRELASHIPDASLTVLDGSSLVLMGTDDAAVSALAEFLGDGEEATTETEPADAGAFRTLLFTDVEGSTALTDRLGDAKARDLLREHERTVREALTAHGGSEVKTLGDGFMASFSSATKALECAIAMQRAFAERNELAEEPIEVRIGLNAGEPIAEDDPGGRSDLYGTAVNLAARIAAQADAGEILASNVVRELVAGKRFLFNDRGETELRGFEDPVRVFEVRWRD
ncbi:MAG TPA: adenylate/guanylate cyclase domain-containing protein [Dehalococcoidia bacterium]